MTQKLFSCGLLPVLGVVLLLVLGFVGLAQAAPGDLDPSFGTDGKVTTDFSGGGDIYNFGDQANALAIQADGKIVVAGSSWYCSVPGSGGSCKTVNTDFTLARYNPDGSLDTTFGRCGKVTTNFGDSDDEANALVLQADGKIVVAGSSNGDFALVHAGGNKPLVFAQEDSQITV